MTFPPPVKGNDFAPVRGRIADVPGAAESAQATAVLDRRP